MQGGLTSGRAPRGPGLQELIPHCLAEVGHPSSFQQLSTLGSPAPKRIAAAIPKFAITANELKAQSCGRAAMQQHSPELLSQPRAPQSGKEPTAP